MQVLNWAALDAAARRQCLTRPALAWDAGERRAAVAAIVARVREKGDAALREYARRFDGAEPEHLRVPEADLIAAGDELSVEARTAIEVAYANIARFHAPATRREYAVETAPGVSCRMLVRPLARVGLYVPGGSAPLPSTVLMLGVPARLAGCREIVLCTPPGSAMSGFGGNVSAAIRFAVGLCGIRTLIAAGGAQAIAAMAYGTDSVPKVDKIFGPGNAWVTEAKQQVAQDPDAAIIDMPAGPSEVLVIADDGADADFVAADLLSQAEHGSDSQALLVTPSRRFANRTAAALDAQLKKLPRAATAQAALVGSRMIVVRDLAEAFAIANRYAPEHLVINTDRAEDWLPAVENAGSVFLGRWTPESLGDYASGTNHVLPTYGYARQSSGLSVADFQKSISVQQASPAGLARLGPTVVTLAELEGLHAHARAVSLRLAAIEAGLYKEANA